MTVRKSKIKKKSKLSQDTFDMEAYQKEVVSGLQSGKGLFGEEGLLKPLIARFVEAALDAEMTAHLAEEKTNPDAVANKRNGVESKVIRTRAGETKINYSRDRAGTFAPITVGKRQREMAVGFDGQILELYAMSNSIGDIRLHLENMYGASMSEARISAVVNSTWL